MRLVVVTGTKSHHKNLCVRLAKNHDLVAIVHPAVTPASHRGQRILNRRRRYGTLHLALAAAAGGPAWLTGWDAARETELEARSRFEADARLFESLPESLIHRNIDIGSDGAALLVKLRPDVVAVLGGPIYPREFIESAPLMLNFHSGISPIYNGTASAQFAFANGHPQLCGGTLMAMSTVVDGGAILGHVLPGVESGDTPASLFVKTVAGAPRAFDRFLAGLAADGLYRAVSQPPPFLYYRGLDWTISHSRRVRRNVERDIAAGFARGEELVEYWREADDAAARRLLETTIADLISKGSA